MRREVEALIISLLEQKGKIHYSDIAVELNVSIPTANRYAIFFSKKYHRNVEYAKGYLILKGSFAKSRADLETRFKALQHSYTALSERVTEAKNELIKALENDFEHKSKEELKKILTKIIQKL